MALSVGDTSRITVSFLRFISEVDHVICVLFLVIPVADLGEVQGK